MATLKIKEYGIDKGRRWVFLDTSMPEGRQYVGAMSYSFVPQNTGHMFSRNRGNGFATAQVTIGNVIVASKQFDGCRYQRDLDRKARAWFREIRARESIHAGWLLGEHIF